MTLVGSSKQEPAQQVLRKSRDALEAEVEKRTAELARANVLLLDEIAERRQAEEALRRSEERYRAISELTSDYAYVLRVEPDNHIKLEWVTEAFIRATGFTVAEIAERGGWPILPYPGDLPIIYERMQALLAGHQTSVREFRIITKDGEVRWLQEHGRPVWDETEERVVRIYGAARDITESKRIEAEKARLFEEVREGRERLRQLASQVVLAQEEERRRVSRELHDEAGQALTALKFSLEVMRTNLAKTEIDPVSLQEQVQEAVALCETTMAQIRSLAHNLRPAALDDLGLNHALQGFCEDFASHTQLTIDYQGLALPPLSNGTDIGLYRFLQEALTNVAKHAGASQVRVALAREDHTVTLLVEDDGRGFDEQMIPSGANQARGMGLLGMQERLELLDGGLEIMSQPGQGTRLLARVPLKQTT